MLFGAGCAARTTASTGNAGLLGDSPAAAGSASLPAAAPPPAPAAAAAASGGEAGTHDTLHLYVSQSPTSLNPLLASTVDEQKLSNLVYDPLVAPDSANHLQPVLARVVPTLSNGGISRDGKTITFLLRKGVRWHDGAPFTSADVAFTFAKINDPKVDVTSRTGYDRIARVATPDPYTVVVTLKEPFAPFVPYVGNQFPIAPKHLLETSADINRDPIGTHPVGTGPYRFERWQRGNRIEYAANDAYFAGAPKFKRLWVAEIPDQNTTALEIRTHQLDFGAVESASYVQLRAAPDVRTATEPLNDFVAYALNTTSPILRDVRVRRAFSMAIDRASIAAKNTYGTGTAAYADLPALLWTAREPANPYAFDPAAANTLLDAAGWKRDAGGMRAKDGVPLRLRGIDFGGSKTGQGIDAQIQQMLRDVGIDWSVKYYSPSLYYETKANGGPLAGGDFDTGAYTWVGGIDAENDMLYTCASRAPAGSNTARYCSPEMDALQRDSLTTLDPARRAADVVKIERLAVTDVPYVFLYHTPWRLAYDPQLRRPHGNLGDDWFDIGHWSYASP